MSSSCCAATALAEDILLRRPDDEEDNNATARFVPTSRQALHTGITRACSPPARADEFAVRAHPSNGGCRPLYLDLTRTRSRAPKYPNTPANTAEMQLGRVPAKYTQISPNYSSVCQPSKSAQNCFYCSKLTQTAHRVAPKAPQSPEKTHQGAWG